MKNVENNKGRHVNHVALFSIADPPAPMATRYKRPRDLRATPKH